MSEMVQMLSDLKKQNVTGKKTKNELFIFYKNAAVTIDKN